MQLLQAPTCVEEQSITMNMYIVLIDVYSSYRFILVSPFSGLLTATLAWHLNKGIIIIIIMIMIIMIMIIIMNMAMCIAIERAIWSFWPLAIEFVQSLNFIYTR